MKYLLLLALLIACASPKKQSKIIFIGDYGDIPDTGAYILGVDSCGNLILIN